MTQCLCGSQIDYSQCCGLYHQGKKIPQAPEALMRSRYCAYALANIDYIKNTMKGKALIGFNESEARTWAKTVKWLGLKVINSRSESSNLGYVEFVARFIEGSKARTIHEISEFHRVDDQWFYVDGVHSAENKAVIPKKVGRNNPCPCGSRKKFKNCHGKTTP